MSINSCTVLIEFIFNLIRSRAAVNCFQFFYRHLDGGGFNNSSLIDVESKLKTSKF